MASDVNEVELEEIAAPIENAIAAGPFGSNLVSRDYVETGVPVIRGQNLQGRWVSGQFVYVSKEKAAKLRRNSARPRDVVFTQRGTLGQVSLVPEGCYPSYVVSQSQMKLTVDESKADPFFVYYACRAPYFVKQVHDNAVAAGVPHINLGILRRLTIPLPKVQQQNAVASMLTSIDDRIECLRKSNSTLEAIAQALFKSWFVDFDPVRAKAEGREPDGMDAATAALFPSRFEASEAGPIPDGWHNRSLDSIATYLNGLALQKYPPESETEFLPVIKIAQLRSGHVARSDKASMNLKPEYVVEDGDVLFSWSGSLLVEMWCGGRGALNQHLFKVTSNEVPKWFYFLATRHHLPHFREIAANKATTMGHIQRRHLTEALVAVPPQRTLQGFSEVVSPVLDSWFNNARRARILQKLRDTLLPHLISGKLRLPDVERDIEAATA